MKSQLQAIADRMAEGKRKHKGRFISPSRLQTIRRVATLVPEIPPGKGSETALHALVSSWLDQYSPATVRTYTDVLKMVSGDYQFPDIDLSYEQREPQHLPLWLAEEIVSSGPPLWVQEPHLWMICRLAINSCLRPGDAISVSKKNISGDTMILKHQKTNKLVKSKLHPALAKDLAERLQVGDVYPTKWYSLRADYRKRILNHFIKDLMKWYEVDNEEMFDTSSGEVNKVRLGDVITAHSLRSTGANYLLSKGVAAHNVMAIGGWALNSPVFIQHYLKPNIDVWNS